MQNKIIAGVLATIAAVLIIVLMRLTGLFKYPLAGFGAAFVAWTAIYTAISKNKKNNKKNEENEKNN